MSHEVETFVYNGEEPWHGIGIPNWDGKFETSNVDWEVTKVPAWAILPNGEAVNIKRDALVRVSDNKVLDVVTEDWNTVQNKVAFEFFQEYCEAGNMTLETCGSLKGGQLVFALAKINESFELFRGKDKVDSYMLFTNPHKYGWSTSVSWTAIRVVCWNTLTASLNNSKGDKIIRVSHRNKFDAEQVKEDLGIAKAKLIQYKEKSKQLAATKAKKEDIVTYFKRIFPVLGTTKPISKSASTCLDILESQPGGNLGKGTWWQPYNAVTFFTDHLAARTQDARLSSSWYGTNRKLKVQALETALEMSKAA